MYKHSWKTCLFSVFIVFTPWKTTFTRFLCGLWAITNNSVCQLFQRWLSGFSAKPVTNLWLSPLKKRNPHPLDQMKINCHLFKILWIVCPFSSRNVKVLYCWLDKRRNLKMLLWTMGNCDELFFSHIDNKSLIVIMIRLIYNEKNH